MKKIVTILVILLFAISGVFAQETLRDVVKDYQKRNSEFTLVIPSFLLKMGLALGDISDEKREVIKQIDDMKIVICENDFHTSDFSMLEDGIKGGNFKELITVNSRDEKVRMVLNEKSKKRSELLMIVEEDNENVMILINFHGEPDFSKFLTLVD